MPAVEHATKIAAAREAIGNADFFLVARTDARSVNGLKDAMARANLYHEVHACIHTYIHTKPSKQRAYLLIVSLIDLV